MNAFVGDVMLIYDVTYSWFLECLTKKYSQSFLKDSMNAIQQSLNQKCRDAASSRRQKLKGSCSKEEISPRSLCVLQVTRINI